MARTFTSDLSVSGIEKLKKQIKQYQEKDLQYKVHLFVKKVADLGVDIAKVNVARLGAVFTGELKDSIHTKDGGILGNKAVFYVVADSKHAVFVEFGTGQLGQEAPYPYPMPEGIEWKYNVGATIMEISDGQYGWFYPKDGKWYFTQGMPSRPFMYETAIELEDNLVKIAKEVFRK